MGVRGAAAALYILGAAAALFVLVGLYALLEGHAEGDVEAGRARAEVCAACHGAQGIPTNPAWPYLARQNYKYLVRQLKAFRDGTREQPIMAAMAGPLSDEDIRNLATYWRSRRVGVRGATAAPWLLVGLDAPFEGHAEGDVEAGRARAAVCAACHGAHGIPTNPAWPNLAGQNYKYLVKQLEAFRDRTRKQAMMAARAGPLSDEDIRNLAAHFASLR